MSGITPSQTVGPYYAYGLTPTARYDWSDLAVNNLITPDVSGERIRIEGHVTDGDGKPINDAMIEIWQADGEGRYAATPDGRPATNARFKGFGRSDTDAEGRYRFTTVRPGPVPGPSGAAQAPHINVNVFARGVLNRLFTRIYFDGEPSNASDPILSLVPAEARNTLIAKRVTQAGEPTYIFDIRLQGQNETVFFEA